MLFGVEWSMQKGRGGCVIGAGHRSELVQYHTHVLEHEEQGRWTFSTVQAYRSRHPLL
jgi:hypothetical protein